MSAVGRRQDGFAVPLVLGLLLVLLALSSVVVLESTSANDSSQRDTRVKRAIAAANAGVASALWRTNTFSEITANPLRGAASCLASVEIGSGPSVPGVTIESETQVGAGAWCPPVTENLGNGERFTYRISSIIGLNTTLATLGVGSTIERSIVSWGTVGTGAEQITRRIEVDIKAFNAARLFLDYAVTSKESVTLGDSIPGSVTTITGGVRTDGDVTLEPSATVCGNIRYGSASSYDDQGADSTTCPGVNEAQTGDTLDLDDVTVPPLDETSNALICPGEAGELACSLTGVTWNATDRTLDLAGGTLTLVGNAFSLCRLEMSGNSTLTLTPLVATAPIVITIDDCPSVAGVNGAVIRGQARIVSAGIFELQMAGDDTIAFSEGIAGTPITANVYAPRGTVTVGGSVEIIGGVVARSARVSRSATVAQAAVPTVISVDASPQFKRERFVECSPQIPAAAVDPDDRC